MRRWAERALAPRCPPRPTKRPPSLRRLGARKKAKREKRRELELLRLARSHSPVSSASGQQDGQSVSRGGSEYGNALDALAERVLEGDGLGEDSGGGDDDSRDGRSSHSSTPARVEDEDEPDGEDDEDEPDEIERCLLGL